MAWLRRFGCFAASVAMLAMALLLPDGREAVAAESAVRLLMFEAPGCPHCKRWHAEIGTIYGKSREGVFAPLDRLPIADASRLSIADVRYSPTFVVVKNGAEIGRVIGYSGPDFFWPQLGEILARVGFEPG